MFGLGMLDFLFLSAVGCFTTAIAVGAIWVVVAGNDRDYVLPNPAACATHSGVRNIVRDGAQIVDVVCIDGFYESAHWEKR